MQSCSKGVAALYTIGDTAVVPDGPTGASVHQIRGADSQRRHTKVRRETMHFWACFLSLAVDRDVVTWQAMCSGKSAHPTGLRPRSQ